MRTPTRMGIDQRELSLLTSRRPSSTSQSTSDNPPMNRSCVSAMNSIGPYADEDSTGRTQAERPRRFEKLAVLRGQPGREIGGHVDERATDILVPVDPDEVAEERREARAGEEPPLATLVYSATKGLAAMTLAIAHSRGWLDYEERVCAYWPEFAQQGKERITVRQLLAHQAGLFALDEPVDRSLVADLDRLAVVLARQKPAWEPGTRQAYHAITLGFYEGELLRRIDPQHRSLGQFFQDEIASPLGLDVYIRLPEDDPELAAGDDCAARTRSRCCSASRCA